MPEDYQDIVLAAYKKMRDNGVLRTTLTGETTTRLREACLRIYDSRYTPKDADTLSMFFKVDRIECDDFRKVIYNSVPDDYKALYNHIKRGTRKTKEENTDLLAWLIDFPTSYEWRGFTNEEKQHVFEKLTKKRQVTRKTGGGNNGDIEELEPEKPIYIPLFSPRYITIACIILLLVCTTSFIVWERLPTTARIPEKGEKFMYWDDDHYEAVKDEKQDVGAAIIPLNIQTLTQQQKITLPDTLTSYSIGKVWYKGHGKDHEFFTDSGAYPLDLQRVLKPLSGTILTKYTSNYRYMLTRLVWFICAAIFISLCGIWASRLKKEVKSQDKLQENDIKEILSASETTPVMNEAELKAV